LSTFLENAFVSLVKRLICILMVRFCRSTYEVHIFCGSGLPTIYSLVTESSAENAYALNPVDISILMPGYKQQMK